MNTSLIVVGEHLAPSLVPEFEAERTLALEKSALISPIRRAEQKPPAVEAQIAVKRLLDAIEKSRVAVKAPFLEAARQIDATAKAAVKDLVEEQMRLAKIVGDYDAELIAEARRKEAERQAELQRIADHEAAEKRRIEAEARAAEEARQREADRKEGARVAELQRIAAEQAKAKNAAQRKKLEEEKAEIEAQRKIDEAKHTAQQAIQDKARETALQRQSDLAAQAAEAVGPEKGMAKVAGQVVKAVWKFEVTDIWLLAKMHPGLVKIEVSTAEINQCLNHGVRQIAGLKIWEEVQSNVRAQQGKFINV